MDATEAARREAERIHHAAVEEGDDPWNLLELVSRESARRDLDVYALAQGDSALKGGRAVLDSQAGCILYEDIGSAFDRAFLIAHELGHFVLEGDTQNVVTEEVEPDRSAEDAPVGVERVLDYGAREHREIRMDLFARELLLPRSVARRHHIDSGCSSVDIATRLGAPLQVVQQQLLDALLLPTPPVIAEPTAAVPKPTPDPTQIAAANHRDTAFLLQAGPGTGKTRTLFDWLKTVHAMTAPSEAELGVRFDQAWQAKGSVDHGYAEDYRRIARRLVDFVIETRSRGVPAPAPPISLGWAEGEILVQPDSVAQGDKGQIVVRRVKTGKPRSNAFDDIEYTLLHLATTQAYGGSAQVEVTYLTSETTQPMEITERKLKTRSEKVQEFVKRVHAGDFPVKEEARTCPRCPSFFICGDLPAGAIIIKKV